MHTEVNKKVEQNFNPRLALIGLSGTGPCTTALRNVKYRVTLRTVAFTSNDKTLRSVNFGVVVVINCECGGIVRNDIFPDTLPYKYRYFSSFVLQTC